MRDVATAARFAPEDLKLNWGEGVGKGRLIAVEGLDGSGKSTFVAALHRALSARKVDTVVEKLPTAAIRATSMFETFRKISGPYDPRAFDPLAMQVHLMADRLAYVTTRLRPLLEDGVAVVLDRYILSGAAHLVVDGFDPRGWFSELTRHLPRPDLHICLTAPAELSRDRIRSRPDEADDEFDTTHFLALQAATEAIARANGLAIIDTSRTTLEEYPPLLSSLLAHLG